MASRLCRACGGWHDLSEPWPDGCLSHFKGHTTASSDGLQIIKDIEPYRSMVTGEVIGGRKQHRDHLRAHRCIEIGNEKQAPRPRQASPSGLTADLKRAAEKRFG